MEYRVKIHTMSRVRLKISWTAVELRSAVAACSYMLPRHSWALEIHSPEADQLGAPSQGRQIRYQVSTCEDDVRLKRVAKLMRYPYSTNWVEFFDCRSRIALSAYERWMTNRRVRKENTYLMRRNFTAENSGRSQITAMVSLVKVDHRW